jgi:hypothetical protein
MRRSYKIRKKNVIAYTKLTVMKKFHGASKRCEAVRIREKERGKKSRIYLRVQAQREKKAKWHLGRKAADQFFFHFSFEVCNAQEP